VERFDRQLDTSGQWWWRLPQEDFCQAKGLPSSLKYHNDGGPGVEDICRILQASENPKADLQDFMTAQVLFWMLAATDGHAKNFSLRILPGGRFQLTPFYDVISVWPVIGRGAHKIHGNEARLAMAVRGKHTHYRLAEIQRRHFNAMAPACGLGRDMEPIIQSILARTDDVIHKVSGELPDNLSRAVAGVVLDKLAASARKLSSMPVA
jgi:serine/threonine-protein kinase HipA